MRVELLSITPNAEKLIETAGCTSYLSFNKQGENTEKNFILMLIKRGHYSALEHAYATFRISQIPNTLGTMISNLPNNYLCSVVNLQRQDTLIYALAAWFFHPNSS